MLMTTHTHVKNLHLSEGAEGAEGDKGDRRDKEDTGEKEGAEGKGDGLLFGILESP